MVWLGSVWNSERIGCGVMVKEIFNYNSWGTGVRLQWLQVMGSIPTRENDTILTSRFFPKGEVRENDAPNATVSTYLFRFVHSHQPLHTCPPGSPRAFYMTFLQYLLYCVFKCQPRSLLTTHFSLLIFFAQISWVRSPSFSLLHPR